MKKGWRKEILQILGMLTCAYFLIMFLMVMQLHVQKDKDGLFYEDQDHENVHFSHTSGYCYKGPSISQIARRNSDFSTAQSMQSRILGSCTMPASSADVEMDALWRTLDVSYPLALSVSGWLDVVQVYSWVTKPLTVIIVPHSHQDPGWLFTFEYYFETYSNKIINLMVEQLTKNQAWRFVWSEVCWLDKWWEKASQSQKDSFIRLVRNGQLEIVSGGWVMPDEAVVHYSAMLNQLIDGHQWLMTHVGITPNISWSIDPFGHSPTMTYLQKRNGARAMVIQRIHFGIKRHLAKIKTMEFQWRQIWDSGSTTDIMTHVLPFLSYAIAHSCGPNTHVCCQFDFYQKKCYYGKKSIRSEEINESNVKAKAWLLWEQFQKKSELFRENVLLVPHGDDFRYSDAREWEKQFLNLEKLMAYINSNIEMNTKVRFGTLSEYFKELEKSQTRPFPTFTGDFFPYSDRSDQYWTGFYTTRPHLKYLARRIQSLLRSVEILYAAAVAKTNKMSEQLNSLLKLLPDLNVGRQELALFQHHDAITGTSRKTVTENYKERLQHAVSKLKPVYEKVTQIYLEQSLSVTQNHTVTMINEWMYGMPLKDLRQKLVHISQKRKLVIFNPLGHSRREVLTLTVDKPNVKVTNSSTTLTIPHQVSPVWEKAGFIEDLYELSFEVNLPALSLSEVTVEKGKATQNTRLILYTKPDTSFITLPGISIHQENSPYFSVSNDYLTAYFYTCNGRLQYVHYKSTGHLWRSEVKVVTYTSGKTWSTMFKDKGGAYTFVPDGPAETLSEPVDALFLIDGPLFSRVVTVQPTITQTVTIYKTHNNMAKGVHIENKVNMHKLDNTEVMMRVESDIVESRAEMCVDLNGFQMHRKTTFPKKHIQGNFYPMTTMASVENGTSKLTLLTTSSRGVASLSPGWLEVGLDRRMNQDDWRGLSEGVTDNESTTSSFVLVFEQKSSNTVSGVCFPSSLTSQLSDELENPCIVAETNYGLQSRVKIELIKRKLPCDIHLVNFRIAIQETRDLTKLQDISKLANFTVAYLLVLQNKQFDCNIKLEIKDCLKNLHELRLDDVFVDCSVAQAWETNLSGTVIVKEIKRPYAVTIDPMEIKTFKMTCN